MASSLELLLLAQASVTDTQVLASNPTINSATLTTLLTAPVAAGTGGYYLRALVGVQANASAGTPQVALTLGSGAVVASAGYGFYYIGGGVGPADTWRTSVGITFSGPTMVTSTFYQMVLEGWISFSTGGTLLLQAATSVAADTWTAQQGSLFTMRPLP
jgi:hypothetical protein